MIWSAQKNYLWGCVFVLLFYKLNYPYKKMKMFLLYNKNDIFKEKVFNTPLKKNNQKNKLKNSPKIDAI